MVNYLRHPLDGCRDRVRRADEHLVELEREVVVMFEKQAHATPFCLAPNPPHSVTNLRLPSETFAGVRLGTLVGEINYNLRCVLDYLVYALAELDSGTPQKGTQFPIMNAAKDFAGRGKAMLVGVNAAHIAAIEQLQPYHGCLWTGQLRDLSNMDKHRHIVPGGGHVEINVHSGLEKDLSRCWGVERKVLHPLTGEQVDVKVYASGELVFEDGSLVMDTIQEIKSGVADTLRRFEPDF